MPKKKQAGSSSARKTRATQRGSEAPEDGVPDVYEDMLAEVALTTPSIFDAPARPVKRRKLIEENTYTEDLDEELFGNDSNNVAQDASPSHKLQVIYDDFEGSDESDVEFEDVELEPVDEHNQNDTATKQESLQIDLSKPATTPTRSVQRRKPITHAERKIRLDVHKWHLLTLLLHLQCRNKWCDSEEVHTVLKPLISRKITGLLHVDESKPQYQRSHSFMKGIEEVCTFWRHEWTINARGMRRAHWRDEVDARKESDEAEDPIDFDDFKSAAHTRSGSRDLGAQLFCALLRSIAVETRLVCSLQVLPFSGTAKGQTPEKSKLNYIHAPAQNYRSSTQNREQSRKRIVESPFPIFWVEVFSPSTMTWIPLDPLVRHTISKPKTGFEPAGSDSLNSMSYVIAFEDDGSAKDVTRRYAQWYNAKTRKLRVENTKGGEEWWDQTMSVFEKPFGDVRDDIEDGDLMKRSASEGMPRNVQDFKGHPIYVLERHLRMNEVIHPRREVGKVTTGAGKISYLESVFRRSDVHLCRTSDAWYRRGRDIKAGEIPLKHVTSKGRKEFHADNDEEDGEVEGVPLYAEYQTSIYEPPPVVDGQIPRNAFGNLDVYVQSMVPAGAIHVRHPLAAKAAKLMNIDYADAVTGFNFKGRQGTAVIDGVVMRENARLAMIAIIRGLESQAIEELEIERTTFILGIWRRWLKALEVRERVEQEYGGRELDDHQIQDSGSEVDEEDETYRDEEDSDVGGGFMPELSEAVQTEVDLDKEQGFQNLKVLPGSFQTESIRHQIIIVNSLHLLPDLQQQDPRAYNLTSTYNANEEAGGFLVDEEEEITYTRSKRQTVQDVDIAGGGFLFEEESERSPLHDNVTSQKEYEGEIETEGGGFLLDDREEREEEADSASLIPSAPPNLRPANKSNILEPSTVETSSREAEQLNTRPAVGLSSSQVVKEPPLLSSQDSKSSLGRDADETSLLSHDPEDDDAEPEWLIESLGE